MKKFILSLYVLILFTVSSQISFAQNTEYSGFLEELFIARQPSPRAEAMGRGLAADNQNDFGSYYNPALTSLTDGLQVNTSFSNRYSYYDSSFYNYFGASYKLKNMGSFGLSRYQYNIGFDIEESTASQPEGTGNIYRIYYDLFSLNYSREVVKDFYAGININAVDIHNSSSVITLDKKILYTLDIGLLKKISLPGFTNTGISHSVSVGTSFYNVTNSKYVFTYTGVPVSGSGDVHLPVIFRGAASYNLKLKGTGFAKNSSDFALLTNFEYEKILNTARYETYKFGAELTIKDILSLRVGHFSRKANVKSTIFDYNTGEFSQFTYGGGIKIPLHLIFNMKTPLSLSIDYVNLKQPTNPDFITSTIVLKNYNTFAVKLNYIPGW